MVKVLEDFEKQWDCDVRRDINMNIRENGLLKFAEDEQWWYSGKPGTEIIKVDGSDGKTD